ncbi:7333_t:CDS:2, partial [Entrophospora sp. SA101]
GAKCQLKFIGKFLDAINFTSHENGNEVAQEAQVQLAKELHTSDKSLSYSNEMTC